MRRQRRPSITPSIESALAGFSFLKDDMSVISDSCSESSITVALTTKLILAKQWRRCQRVKLLKCSILPLNRFVLYMKVVSFDGLQFNFLSFILYYESRMCVCLCVCPQ